MCWAAPAWKPPCCVCGLRSSRPRYPKVGAGAGWCEVGARTSSGWGRDGGFRIGRRGAEPRRGVRRGQCDDDMYRAGRCAQSHGSADAWKGLGEHARLAAGAPKPPPNGDAMADSEIRRAVQSPHSQQKVDGGGSEITLSAEAKWLGCNIRDGSERGAIRGTMLSRRFAGVGRAAGFATCPARGPSRCSNLAGYDDAQLTPRVVVLRDRRSERGATRGSSLYIELPAGVGACGWTPKATHVRTTNACVRVQRRRMGSRTARARTHSQRKNGGRENG